MVDVVVVEVVVLVSNNLVILLKGDPGSGGLRMRLLVDWLLVGPVGRLLGLLLRVGWPVVCLLVVGVTLVVLVRLGGDEAALVMLLLVIVRLLQVVVVLLVVGLVGRARVPLFVLLPEEEVKNSSSSSSGLPRVSTV